MKTKALLSCLCSIVLSSFFLHTSTNAQTNDWLWGKRGGSPVNSSNVNGSEDWVLDMATDQNGNVYTLSENTGAIVNIDGHSGVHSNDKVSLSSWDCEGNFRWSKSFGTHGVAIINSLAVDSLGGVYVCGLITSINAVSPAYFDTDTTLNVTNKIIFVAKYDTSGDYQWLRMPQENNVNLANSIESTFFKLETREDGRLYIFAHLAPGNYANGAYTATNNTFAVVNYSKDGDWLGVIPLDMSVSIRPDGTSTQSQFKTDYFHFARDPYTGKFYLVHNASPNYGSVSFGNNPVVTSAPAPGVITVTPLYLAAFDSLGNHLWFKQSNGNNKAGSGRTKPQFDALGNIYMIAGGRGTHGNSFAGFTFTNTSHANCSVVKLDPNGNVIWSSQSEPRYLAAPAGTLNLANNKLYVSSPYGISLRWGNDSITAPNTNIGGVMPVYIALTQLDPATGNVLKMDSLATNTNNNFTSAATVDNKGNVYIGGTFFLNITIAGNTLSRIGGDSDWFIAKFGTDNCNCTMPQASYNSNANNQLVNFNYNGSNDYYSISWDFGDGQTSNIPNPTHAYTSSGTYQVCVTVTNSCGSDTYCQSITVTQGTNINNISGLEQIKIYPNPANNILYIKGIEKATSLVVYNALGQRIWQQPLNTQEHNINISNWTKGIYLLQFTSSLGEKGTIKIVKE